jgi:hypothetical protein
MHYILHYLHYLIILQNLQKIYNTYFHTTTMTRPITHLTSNSTSVPKDSPPSSSSTPQDTLQEMLAIMHCLEQRLDDTEKCLDDLEAVDVLDQSNFVTNQAIDAILAEKFSASYGSTMESISCLSALVAELHIRSQPAPQALPALLASSRPSGFFQKDSKDFHVSHLIELLTDESLASDSLQDLEIFYDSILSHFNTIALTADLYPKYQDLSKSFDFYRYLTRQDHTV